MLLSRFWYLVLAVTLGATVFSLFLATSMFDRASTRAMGEALAGDSQVVASYLRDDARKRSIALMIAAFDEEIRGNLAKASAAVEKVPFDVRDKVKVALRKQFSAIPADQKFDALFAVDQTGRVVAQVGFDQASGIDNFELGGYPIVADALHGWVRDDSWVLGGRIYRIVARPVENEIAAQPAGAVVGARIIDDSFARELSKRTGAAVGFYANGARVSSGAPEGFDTAQLDTITNDLKGLDKDPTYKEKGFSDVRTISETLGVVYARVVGEAWDMGAGYAVARNARIIGSPLGFFKKADDKDKSAVPFWILVLVTVVGAGIGIIFTLLEHTRPLHVFRTEAARFAKGENDQLTPSRFHGVYRKIASDVNDGTDKIAAKGGVPRKAANLEQVLGPMPAQPAMSAFSLPQDSSSSPTSGRASSPRDSGSGAGVAAPPPAPKGAVAAAPAAKPGVKGLPAPRGSKPQMPAPSPSPVSLQPDDSNIVAEPPQTQTGPEDEKADWQNVFVDYLRVKKECGESVDGITFDKFQVTLRKNREQLVSRHGCKAVKFSVYVKDGRAAIKANPIRE